MTSDIKTSAGFHASVTRRPSAARNRCNAAGQTGSHYLDKIITRSPPFLTPFELRPLRAPRRVDSFAATSCKTRNDARHCCCATAWRRPGENGERTFHEDSKLDAKYFGIRPDHLRQCRRRQHHLQLRRPEQVALSMATSGSRVSGESLQVS
jgi:hypothetical protein